MDSNCILVLYYTDLIVRLSFAVLYYITDTFSSSLLGDGMEGLILLYILHFTVRFAFHFFVSQKGGKTEYQTVQALFIPPPIISRHF